MLCKINSINMYSKYLFIKIYILKTYSHSRQNMCLFLKTDLSVFMKLRINLKKCSEITYPHLHFS